MQESWLNMYTWSANKEDPQAWSFGEGHNPSTQKLVF